MSLLPGPLCKKCPLYFRVHCHVPSTVNRKVSDEKVDMVLVGELPRKEDVAKHEVFSGAAGSYLNTMLDSVGIDRSKVRLTSVLKCNSKNNNLPEDTDLAIECCAPLLEKDIQGAKVIVGFGALPLKAFTGLGKIQKRRGSVYPLKSGQPFLATLHPSWLRKMEFVQSESKRGLIPKEVGEADLSKALRIVNGEDWLGWSKKFTSTPYPSVFEISLFLDRLYNGKEKWVQVDIETTHDKKNPWKVPLLCGFSFHDWGLCVGFEEDWEIDFLLKALASPTPKVFHNGVFDIKWLEEVGLKVNNYAFDTLYMHHGSYAELPHSLAFVQSLYTWMPYHKDLVSWVEEDEGEEIEEEE